MDKKILKSMIRKAYPYHLVAQPNPSVVAAVLKNGKVIAEARHEISGSDHAEVIALKKAGIEAKGATLYISLEPCTHHGKTPPCVDAIIQAGIAKVIYAIADPNPKVQARSAQVILEAAGIEVIANALPKEAAYLHRVFLTNILAQRPYVMLKVANTLDGKIANADKESMYLTGPSIRRWVHQQREALGAVLVGIGTVLADDPQLTVRHHKSAKQPTVIICDSKAQMPLNARVLQDTSRKVFWVLNPGTKLPQKLPAHVEVIRVPSGPKGLDLAELLRQLYQKGVLALMCEGGQGLFSSFLETNLVDELAFCVAPTLMHQAQALSAFSLEKRDGIKNLARFDLENMKKMDEDVLLRYSVKDAPYKSTY